jgi:hypothetical protein
VDQHAQSLSLDFGYWMIDRVSLTLKVLNPAPQGATRGLGLRPPAPGPLRRGDRRRRSNDTESESEADPRAFQVVVTIGTENRAPISQGGFYKRVRCAEVSAPKGAIDAQSIIQWPRSSMRQGKNVKNSEGCSKRASQHTAQAMARKKT